MYNESLFSVSPSIQMSVNCVALNYSEYFNEQHSSNYSLLKRFYTVNPSIRQMSINRVALNYSKYVNEQHSSNYSLLRAILHN